MIRLLNYFLFFPLSLLPLFFSSVGGLGVADNKRGPELCGGRMGAPGLREAMGVRKGRERE